MADSHRSDPTDGLLMTLDEKVDPARAAVLVIDQQNDFVASTGFAARVGWNVTHNQVAADNTDHLVSAARAANVHVIFVQATYDADTTSAPMRERNLRRGLTEPRCLPDTWGADFYSTRPLTHETTVVKHRYSAFAGTDLDTTLRARGIMTVILTGVYTEGCVEATARDAYHRDYYVVLVDDCCGTRDAEVHRAAMDRCAHLLGVVADRKQVTAAWATSAATSKAASDGAVD